MRIDLTIQHKLSYSSHRMVESRVGAVQVHPGLHGDHGGTRKRQVGEVISFLFSRCWVNEVDEGYSGELESYVVFVFLFYWLNEVLSRLFRRFFESSQGPNCIYSRVVPHRRLFVLALI